MNPGSTVGARASRRRNPAAVPVRSTGMRKIFVALVALALLAAGCGGSDDESEKTGSAPPVSLAGTTNNHGTMSAKDGLEMEADDFYFGPTFLRATAGQVFTVELHNEGKNPHTFTISGLGIDEQLAPGEGKTVKVTAPQSGSTPFICRFHQGQGMQGAIFVA